MNTDKKCINCGADYGLHRSETYQCPHLGIEETRDGVKQRWDDTCFEDEKSDFLVMQEMSEKNMDIACAIDLLGFDRNKKGGKVTIGVASPQFDHLINQAGTGKQTHYAIMYIINKEQFDKIKNPSLTTEN